MNAEQKRKARAALLKQLQEYKFYVTYTFVDGTELKVRTTVAIYE